MEIEDGLYSGKLPLMFDEATALLSATGSKLVPRRLVEEPMIDNVRKPIRNRPNIELSAQSIDATFGELFVEGPRGFLRFPVDGLPGNLGQLENAFVGLSTMQDGSRTFLKIAFRLRVGPHLKFEPLVYELKRFLH